MTAILNTTTSKIFVRSAQLLLVGASGLALSAPLAANQLLFTTSDAQPETGQRIDQRAGLTQVALTGGGTVSIVDAAEYRINPDGSIDLYEGAITVAAGASGEVVVRMPEGLEGRVAGTGAAGNFAVRDNGEASGHALTGAVRIGRAGSFDRFGAGELWRARGRGGVRRVIANVAQVQPAEVDEVRPAQANSVVPIGDDAGPVAAVLNGIPTGFADQLAAAGASSDILAAARRVEAGVGNPVLDNFPSGDLALLVAAAARIDGSYGGTPFPAAQADIIRAYLRFLAGGGAGSEFLTAYSGFVVGYLDLVRAGGLPSGFASASPADVEAYLDYIRRTGALTALASRDRVLAEAYLAFLANGGNRDLFAGSFTDLTIAYFAFVRGGGDPAAFTGANEAALAQTIAFLRDSGLVVQLSAADRALVDAFLANGGLAFAAQYETALGDYFAFLASGRRPSEYTALDQATLRAYLETLANTGLLTSVLGDRAGFYADYLAFLRSGGSIDGFAGLPANIFAGYAVQLDAYFAFLAGGRLPSEFSGTDLATLQAWLLELQAAGALERFLGARSMFFAEFAAFVAGGGTFDGFAGLPANIFAGYAVQLDAYFAFLASGRLPSEFDGVELATLQAWLLELQDAGALERFLGARAAFFAAFAAFVADGGSFDAFASLPANVFAGYAVDLRAFFDFLLAGGVPSDYTLLSPETIREYIAALETAGATGSFLGDLAAFYREYAIYLAGGGNPDLFAGLPVPPDFPAFAAALNAYALFLQGGGLPSDYTAEDLAQLQSFLGAVVDSGQLAALLGDNADLLTRYFAFLAGGGDPNGFIGLPVYVQYIAALNAYYEFLVGGGQPSGYAELDAATIEAYLAALSAIQGGLAGIDDLNQFFVDYFIYIAGGGDPDLFAGLPVNGGGGGGGGNPGGVSTELNGVNAWVFGADALRINTAADVEVDTDGRITSVTLNSPAGNQTFNFDPNSGNLREFGRIGDAVAWSRYFVGRVGNQPNVSQHVMVGTPATNLPGTGTVSYQLVGGTAPTNRYAADEATGWFTGNLAVQFGAVPLVGLDFELFSRTEGYRVSTQGGAANPGLGGMGIRADGTFENQNLAITRLTDTTCLAFCQAQVFGGAFGDGAEAIGFTYNVFDQRAGNAIQGIAIFGTSGDAIDGIGTPPGGGGGGDTTTTKTDQNLAFVNLFVGDDAVAGGSVTFDDAGNIVGYQSRDREIFAKGSTQIAENGTAEGVTWTRWADGTPEGDYYGTTVFDPVGVNGGWHVIAGDALTNMPGSGTIAYDLTGHTTPTRSGEGTSTGSVTGSAAVQFGSTARFGLDLTVTSGVDQINMATDGGVTDVSQSRLTINADGIFNSRGTNPEINTTNIAGNFCAAGCLSFVQGFLSGDGASGAGLSYAIRQEGVTPQGFINGTAAFSKGDPIAPPPPTTGNPPSTFVLTDHLMTQSGRSDALDLTSEGGNFGFVGYETNDAGEIVGFRRTFNGNLYDRIGTARNADSGRSDSGLVRWTRWTEGTLETLRLGPVNPVNFSADQGYHAILGTPATNLPTTGRIDYDLVGGTSPTSALGRAAPGRLISGAAAVEFGSTSRVGIEMALEFSGQTIEAKTTGGLTGIASSELSLGQNATFRALGAFGNVTSSGNYCAATCRVLWEGFLAGNGASELGVTYQIQANDRSTERLVGTAAFASSGAAANATTASGVGAATSRGGLPVSASASVPLPAPTPASAMPADWSRWAGGAVAVGPVAGRPDTTSSIGWIAPDSLGIEGRADGADRRAAIRQAEQLMGGLITFPGASPDQR
jgi:trimeric autotransporter adhesin